MFWRISPPLMAFGASILLLAGLLAALYWNSEPAESGEPLEVYCAEALRIPLQAIAQEYEKEFRQKVILHFGPSQTILTNFELTKKGDLLLPADESYVRQAKKKGLVSDVFNLATMNAVIIVRPNCPRKIVTWDDFLATQNKRIGLANVGAAAISKILKQALQSAGLWDALAQREPTYMGNVNEVANSVRLGTVDVGIVWDVIAQPHPDLTVVKVKELETVKARVQMALAKSSSHPDEAKRFVRYLRSKDKGAPYLKKQGYSDLEETGAMDNRPELVVYAGAMLQPALEESLKEFEKRENVRITRVYNGCGILVSAMQTGETPDVFFSCDTSFMKLVKEKFNEPTNVSSNQLVIAVKKGNPHEIAKLADLAKPKLRVGVGHEQQCALGAITKQAFNIAGIYGKIVKNVVLTSPTGDFLINQLRTGSLDAVVAYRSNVTPYEQDLEGIPVVGISCATPQQPIAISKNSAEPQISRRLLEFLRSEESRQRFEKLGFGWEVKEVEAPK
jgi:molybdate transport system substrate-binding protein